MATPRTKRPAAADGLTREERTRREIISVTRSLVERHGFSKVTLEDIAGALGKKKSFLYYYFPDKEAILSAMVDEEARVIRASIEEAVGKEPTGKEKIRTYIVHSHKELKKRLPLIAHLRLEIQAKEHSSLAMLLEQSRKVLHADIPMMQGLLREGVRDKSLRKLSPAEIESVAHFTVMVLHGIEYDYMLGGADERIEEYFLVAIKTLEHGIAA